MGDARSGGIEVEWGGPVAEEASCDFGMPPAPCLHVI